MTLFEPPLTIISRVNLSPATTVRGPAGLRCAKASAVKGVFVGVEVDVKV
jgi:hypothetical protein